MSWIRTAPQQAQHSDGFVVGNAGREAVEYVDGARRALISIDRGRESSRLYTDSLVWVEDGTEVQVEEPERSVVLDRIVAGLAVLSSSAVERFPA